MTKPSATRTLRELFDGVRLSGRVPPDDELAKLTDDAELRDEVRRCCADVLERMESGDHGDAQRLGEAHAERLGRRTRLTDDQPDELADLTDDQLADLAHARGQGRMVSPSDFRKGN